MAIDPPGESSCHSAHPMDEPLKISANYFYPDDYDRNVTNHGYPMPVASVVSSASSSQKYAMSDPPTAGETEHQLVKWVPTPSDNDFGETEKTPETDEFCDFDEDDCEEHYRQPKNFDEGKQKQRYHHQEQQLALPPKRLIEAEEKVLPAPKELVANLHNQLALVAPTSKYNGYQHLFITVRDEHRFLMLYTLLKRNVNNKVIVFFSTTKSTQYFSRLLQRLKFDVRAIHNGQSKEKFLESFFEFSRQPSGILCLPDFQGNEFAIPPTVSCIVQFEPPGNPSEYIFRVGRISSEVDAASGRALLFLSPSQFGFLQYYKAASVKIYEYEIPKISNVQRNYERLIRKDARLRKLAREAYHAYLMTYASHDFRDVYTVHELDHEMVALSFGFNEPPSRLSADDEEDEERLKASSHGKFSREDRSWKPVKTKKESWLPGQKTWRFADRHACQMKVTR